MLRWFILASFVMEKFKIVNLPRHELLLCIALVYVHFHSILLVTHFGQKFQGIFIKVTSRKMFFFNNWG